MAVIIPPRIHGGVVTTPLHRRPFLSVPLLILAVHSEEPQHHQVEERSYHCQPHKDVHETKDYIRCFFLEVLLLLKSHKVPEADGGESDETVVVRVEERPALKVREGSGSHAQSSQAGQETYQNHVFHGNLRAMKPKAFLDAAEEVADERVHPLAQTLEHHQCKRDAQDGIEHAEDLSRVCAGGCMAVTCRKAVPRQHLSQIGGLRRTSMAKHMLNR